MQVKEARSSCIQNFIFNTVLYKHPGLLLFKMKDAKYVCSMSVVKGVVIHITFVKVIG